LILADSAIPSTIKETTVSAEAQTANPDFKRAKGGLKTHP